LKVGESAAWASFCRNPLRLPSNVKRVLVIDDRESFRQFVPRCLEPKVKVRSAASGEEGVSIARAFLPDLILVDWVLREMSGENVVRALREDAATRSIPTVMVSAYIDPNDPREAQRARAAGADLFLTKDRVQQILLSYRQENAAPRTTTGRVLVIDDDPGTQDFIRHVLAAKNLELDFAADGRKGLALARDVRPAAILLDLMLPVLNGVDVLKLLQADPATRDIPVLLMTNMADNAGVMDSMIQGLRATDCIHKPFGAEEFAARVARLLAAPPTIVTEQEPAARDLILRRGRIQINLTRNEVSVEGRPLKLWRSLFTLLRVLISHAEAVSVERLIADGGMEGKSPDAVRKAVQRLRADLKLSGDAIVAVGRGYKLVG